MKKLINYEFDIEKIDKDIKELESKIYKTEREKNLLRKYKSQVDENEIIKYLNNKKSIKAIKYIKDMTSKDITTFEEFEQNILNCMGTDLIVQTLSDEFIKIDIKVLEYYPKHYKTNRIYNGKLIDNKWGMENFIFQVEGKMDTLGWSNNRYKQTDLLMIYIKATNKIYGFDYKKLVSWINEKINTKAITEKDHIVFDKRYGITKTRECVVSIPTDEIPKGVIVSIYNIK